MIVDGTTYKNRTPKAVIDILEESRKTGLRIRLHYGTTEEGKDKAVGTDWLDEWGMTGHVGRSTGLTKIPLIISSKRSFGGPAILDDCIVRIRAAKGGKDLYRHPEYKQGNLRFARVTGEHAGKYSVVALINGEPHARFKTDGKARQWAKKLGFSRWSFERREEHA